MVNAIEHFMESIVIHFLAECGSTHSLIEKDVFNQHGKFAGESH